MRLSDTYPISLGLLGLGFLHAWLWSLMYGMIVIPFGSLSSSDSSLLALCWSGTLFLCFLVFSAVGKRLPAFFKTGIPSGLAAVIGSLGTALAILAFRQSEINSFALALVGIVISGVAMSCLMISWSDLFSRMEYRQVQVSTALSISLGTAVFLACTYLPYGLAQISAAAFPILSFVFLRSKEMTTPHIERVAEAQSEKWPLIIFAVCLTCLSIANSFLRGLNLSVAADTETSTGTLLFNAIPATCLVLAFAKTPKLLSSIAILCISGGLGLLALSTPELGSAAVGTGFICFEILAWMVSAETVKRSGWSIEGIAGTIWASLYLGSIIGILLGQFTQHHGGLQSNLGVIVCLVIAYLAIMVFVLNYNKNFLKVFEPVPEEAQPATLMTERAKALAEDLHFTEREREILLILVNGRSAKYVAQELVISDNTVKTHIKNIYRKAEVSSKDQLLDKVASWKA